MVLAWSNQRETWPQIPAWSKLEEYAARLALVIYFARWAANDPSLHFADAVDVTSMAGGIALATWFKGEARRVYALLGETDDDRDRRRLVEWIERRGGSATPRDAQMGCRWLRAPGAADTALEQLVKAGSGKWEPTPRGQPTRRFRLSRPSTTRDDVMAKRKRRLLALSDQLRVIIRDCGRSRNSICVQAKVDPSQLHRFVNGEGRLTTDSLDRLGRALKLRITAEED